MDSGGPGASELWLEIDITQVGTSLSVTARGGQQMESSEHPPFPLELATDFGAWVKRQAERHSPLSPPEAPLQQALFPPAIREVLHKLQGAAQGRPLLLKLKPRGPALKAIAWEALRLPGSDSEFLGTSPELLLARGVASTTPWQKREVQGAVRLLVISPEDTEAPRQLKSGLSHSLASGELEWLEPLTGPRATRAKVEHRLRQEPVPHILHFIGHGGLHDGVPSLKMAAENEQEPGYPVHRLAEELRNLFKKRLRLIVLESCHGAQPGELLSAAEELAQDAAGAVLAHLWEVKADVARECSAAFYRSLTGSAAYAGDVARSLHDARRTVLTAHQGSAAAFSPVLYLRGHQPVLFDFSRRRVVPPRTPPVASPTVDPAVGPLLELIHTQPFSLVLGDHLLDEAWTAAVDGFRQRLHAELKPLPRAAPEHLPVSAVAQRYVLQFNAELLRRKFWALTHSALPAVPLVEALARRLPPGFHLTLLRLPALEQALVRHRPERSLYVIWPSPADSEAPLILRHEPGQGWSELHELPGSFEPSRDIALVRLYRGLMQDADLHEPLLTEDDHLHGVRSLHEVLPADLATRIQKQLKNQPAVLIGMSLEFWEHRNVLHSVFNRGPMPAGSHVVVEPEAAEVGWWKNGRALPRGQRERGVSAVQVTCGELARLLDAAGPGEAP